MKIIAPPVSSSFTTLEGVLSLVVDLLSFAIGFAAVLAVAMLVYAGFLLLPLVVIQIVLVRLRRVW